MKEFYKNDIITNNVMSFTGFKALVLFEYLLQEPRSFEEINDYFSKHKYLKEQISIDTLRVYINSLERIGCKIVRGKKTEGAKYRIEKQPYDINPTEAQIKSIMKICKILYKTADIEDIIPLSNFIDKLTKNLDNESLKFAVQKLSPLAKVNKEILTKLIISTQNKDEITIKYKSPSSGIKDIDLLAERIALINNRLHLQGTSLKYKSGANFLISKILEITAKEHTIKTKSKPVVVRCQITDTNFELENNERIIEENENTKILEITSTNMFFAKQRILSLGKICKVLSPQALIDDIIQTLKEMEEVYGTI